MRIDFQEKEAVTLPGMYHGTGTMTAKIHQSPSGKLIPCTIHPGGSIGIHRHETSDDLSYVISGTGLAITDGVEEPLHAGVCHICKKGSAHCIRNTGAEDLVLFTVVVER